MRGVRNPERVHGEALAEGHKSVGMLFTNLKAFPHLFRYIVDTRRFRGLINET